MNISLSAFAPENLVSRDGFGSPVRRQLAHLHTQADSGAYFLRDSSRVPRQRPFIHLKLPYTIGSVPSLSGWRSLLTRVCRHRAAVEVLKVIPVTGAAFSGVTMDQLRCASIFPHPLIILVCC